MSESSEISYRTYAQGLEKTAKSENKIVNNYTPLKLPTYSNPDQGFFLTEEQKVSIQKEVVFQMSERKTARKIQEIHQQYESKYEKLRTLPKSDITHLISLKKIPIQAYESMIGLLTKNEEEKALAILYSEIDITPMLDKLPRTTKELHRIYYEAKQIAKILINQAKKEISIDNLGEKILSTQFLSPEVFTHWDSIKEILIGQKILNEDVFIDLETKLRNLSFNDEQIAKAIEIISIPKRETTDIMKSVKQTSKTRREKLIQKYPYRNIEKREKLEKSAQTIFHSQRVAINIGKDTLISIMQSGRFKSAFELEKQPSDKGNTYKQDRDRWERKADIRMRGNEKYPHPIYGGLYCSNTKDEKVGPAPFWGEIFVVLKTEQVKDRTTFSYGDSNYETMMMWDDAAYAKAILNDQKDEEYVEAQIHGGVSIEDIESVNIPSHIEESAKQSIQKIIKEQFPSIAINVI